MPDRPINKRPLYIGVLLDVVGAALIVYAAFSPSDQHDTVLFGMGAVLLLTAAVFIFMAVRSPR